MQTVLTMEEYNLNQTIENLSGPPKEHITVHNYWAATGFDRYHENSKAIMEFVIEGVSRKANLS